MYKRILVPLDGSYRAEAIMPHVVQLATEMGSEVIFLHVLEPRATPMTPYDMFPYYDEEDDEHRRQEADEYLEGVVARFAERGLQGRKILIPGPIVRGILDIAAEEGVDLIAMASHGRTGLARVFYGSVAAGVLHQADRPLLMVRSEGDD